MKAKKNNKLILQISAVMIPIIIAMMGGILYIVYDSTVKGFLDAQNGMMTKKLTDMGSDTVWDIELSDWCFDYFNEHPEIIYDTEINVDDNEFSAYFDADNAWTVEWVESAPKELQEYAAKMYLANIRNSASWVTKDENYVSLFMFMTAAENEGRMLYEFNGPKSEGWLEKEEYFDLSVHGSVADAIENESDEIFFERTKHFTYEGSFYIGYVPVKVHGKIRAVIGIAYSWKDFSAVMSSTFHKAIWLGAADMLLAAVVLLVLLYRKAIAPVSSIQHSLNEYVETKDSAAMIDKMSKVKSTNEIGQLSVDISDVVAEINRYMKENIMLAGERERVAAELNMATQIQASQLPREFPPFPDRKEFDIYASMTPAKEVGGDFYDFFLIDDDHLAIVMADVSGKGVPAALFMMISKLLINNFAKQGNSPGKVLELTNDAICQNNEEEMFVTVWLGVLEISTGKIKAANAGHEYPVIKNAGGEFVLFKDKHGFVLGGMEGVRYKEYEMQLEKGGFLFLYTDGVPEATNSETELFGTDRLLKVMNEAEGTDPKAMLERVKASVDEFVGEADQFDDLTMLGVTLL